MLFPLQFPSNTDDDPRVYNGNANPEKKCKHTPRGNERVMDGGKGMEMGWLPPNLIHRLVGMVTAMLAMV